MIRNLDVATIQQALDALISGDQVAAANRFTDDVVLTGMGGCLSGRTVGIAAVLDRFAEMSRLTDGTFGTEVESAFRGSTNQHVVVTRHWASIDEEQVHGTQALLITTDGARIRTVDVLSRPGSASGVWD